MPKNQKKRTQNRSKRSSRKRSDGSDSYSLANRASFALHTILPERYRTSVCSSMVGYIPAGFSTAAAGNYASIYVNSLYSPWNTPTFPLTSGTGSYSYGFHATLINGMNIADGPIGYNFLATNYGGYRVKRYLFKATVQPQAATDSVALVVVPLGNEEIVSAAASAVNVRVFGSQPRSKTKNCIYTASHQENTVTMEMDTSLSLGLTPIQWECFPSTAMVSHPTASFPTSENDIASYVGIFVQPLNGSANTSVLQVRFELTMDVECCDLIANYQ